MLTRSAVNERETNEIGKKQRNAKVCSIKNRKKEEQKNETKLHRKFPSKTEGKKNRKMKRRSKRKFSSKTERKKNRKIRSERNFPSTTERNRK
jgi:transposase